jgi:hypothetical protein
MKSLLLLDADVIIDLHSLGLFEKMSKSYSLFVTQEVKMGKKVTAIKDVKVEHLVAVQKEAREARLAIDSGESTSIAYILQGEKDIKLCSCDKAAIKLLAYMNLENHGNSLEKALKSAGHHAKLYPRHLESSFQKCIKEGKVLRIQYKKIF